MFSILNLYVPKSAKVNQSGTPCIYYLCLSHLQSIQNTVKKQCLKSSPRFITILQWNQIYYTIKQKIINFLMVTNDC